MKTSTSPPKNALTSISRPFSQQCVLLALDLASSKMTASGTGLLCWEGKRKFS